MNLKILLPSKVLIEEKVIKVIAEAQNGYFCLLPRHIDFVTTLVPGILSYQSEKGEEIFLAVDEGVLIKFGQEVLVSTRNAIRSPDLDQLKRTVEKEFKTLDEHEKVARSAVAKIEANFIRRFLEIQEHGR
jgi:F-type H+-transporting ATPase subunit epsilon